MAGNAWLLLNDVVCRAASVLYDFGALCLKQKGISISRGDNTAKWILCHTFAAITSLRDGLTCLL
ncbi:hypothetical protein FA041_09305 [Escherichia coli]|nr:hypothetical protein [Escherichia coli]